MADNDAAYVLPGTLSMTSDEASKYTNITNDALGKQRSQQNGDCD